MAAEIVVTGRGQNITDGDTTPRTADGTDFGPQFIDGGSVSSTFVIRNTGTETLDLSSARLFGVERAAFEIATAPASSVAPGASTTITVKFDPSIGGTTTATLVIDNCDSDENPFDFVISGTGSLTPTPPPAPEIAVSGKGIAIADGDASAQAADGTDFGSVAVTGGMVTSTFVVENSGNAALDLSNARIAGADAASFSIQTAPGASVAPGLSTTVTVKFDPTSAGTKNATLLIDNNDSDENPYDFALKGQGVVPPSPPPAPSNAEIQVFGRGNEIFDGDTSPRRADATQFGKVEIDDDSQTSSFLVRNAGTDLLEISQVRITGANAGDFSVTRTADIATPSKFFTSFDITFDPSSTGLKTARVEVLSNDADEGVFDFVVQGRGIDTDTDGPGFAALLQQFAGSGAASPSLTQITASHGDPFDLSG